MRLEDAPDADARRRRDVLVRVRAAGVNPVDTYIRSGTYARKPPLPYTPGTDGAGEVEAVGADVKGFTPGDRVYIAGDNCRLAGAGTYAEHARLPRRRSCIRCRARVSFAQGAALGVPYAHRVPRAVPARRARGRARPCSCTAPPAASASPPCELARAHGMRGHRQRRHRRGLASRARARRRRRRQPPRPGLSRRDHARDRRPRRRRHPRDGRAHQPRQGSHAARHATDASSSSATAAASRSIRAAGDGPRRGDSRHDAVQRRRQPSSPRSTRRLVAGLANGTLNPVVGREMPLADAARAHEAVMEPGALGKIVLTV